MGREHFVGQRAYHYERGLHGVIIDVHLDVRPQTAKLLPDGWDESRATWFNLENLKLMPPEAPDEDRET